MKKGTNTNHPAIGTEIKVDPIKEIKDIKSIKKLLAGKPRDLALFTLGINTNLRASDLLKITVDQVAVLKVDGEITFKETKTQKYRRTTLNAACISAIQTLLESTKYSDTDFLFKGQRGVLTVPSVTRLVKSWCRSLNLKGNYGSHTLRKTWGYHQRVTFKVGLPELMVCFNHSTQKQTLDYLCIQAEEIKNIYQNEL